MANDFCTVCPTGCTDPLLPALATDDCAKPHLSQIEEVFIRPDAATGPADWEDASDWAAVIDNTNTDNTKVKRLPVIGGLPAPDKAVVELPKGKKMNAERTYKLELRTKDTSDKNVAFAKALQCGSTNFAFWYATRGLKLYGGQDGIVPSMVDADLILAAGNGEYEEIVINIEFKACGDPTAIVNPLA